MHNCTRLPFVRKVWGKHMWTWKRKVCQVQSTKKNKLTEGTRNVLLHKDVRHIKYIVHEIKQRQGGHIRQASTLTRYKKHAKHERHGQIKVRNAHKMTMTRKSHKTCRTSRENHYGMHAPSQMGGSNILEKNLLKGWVREFWFWKGVFCYGRYRFFQRKTFGENEKIIITITA